ncbi:unnamed protein product, partial [Heterosigma akashiwo]
HRETDCPYRLVKCRFNCGKEMEAMQLKIHESVECELRTWECLCGDRLPFKHKTKHESVECLMRVVKCSACGEEMTEGDRKEHETDLCVMRPWICGCGITVPIKVSINSFFTESFDKSHHEMYECSDPSLACLNGCGMLGREAVRKAHEENECPLRLIICDCGDAFQAKDLQIHKDNYCEERAVACPLCNEPTKIRDLEKHTASECLHRVVPCKQGCGRAVVAGQLEDHMARVCPQRPVPCKLCGKEMPHRALEAHERSLCRV